MALQESVQAPASAPASVALESYTDGFEQVSQLQGEWAAKFAASAPVEALSQSVAELAPASLGGDMETEALPVDWMEDPTPVIQQSKETDCGAATVAMLARSTGKPTAASDTQLMSELDSRFASSAGTTPKQLTDMLAHEGVAVTQGASILDPNAMDAALSKGNKVVVMVDSNKILPGEEAQGPGKAHWVVVDGKDEQGQYSVKDPGTGSGYSVGVNELADAVNSNWSTNNGGGMLVVEKAQEGVNESALAEKSGESSRMLGTTPGIGSNARGTYGRESS